MIKYVDMVSKKYSQLKIRKSNNSVELKYTENIYNIRVRSIKEILHIIMIHGFSNSVFTII